MKGVVDWLLELVEIAKYWKARRARWDIFYSESSFSKEVDDEERERKANDRIVDNAIGGHIFACFKDVFKSGCCVLSAVCACITNGRDLNRSFIATVFEVNLSEDLLILVCSWLVIINTFSSIKIYWWEYRRLSWYRLL